MYLLLVGTGSVLVNDVFVTHGCLFACTLVSKTTEVRMLGCMDIHGGDHDRFILKAK